MTSFRQIALVLLVLIGAPVAAALAQEASGVPLPAVPKAVKPAPDADHEQLMRSNHMSLLKHKRDLTVHEGDRTPQYSLNECVTCHAVTGGDGKAVTVADPQHFCRACHDYVAVKIDCFECHASRPGDEGKAAGLAAPGESAVAALSDYLQEVEQ